ncbi:hypothetical protein C8Q80DRAFT_609348 [Daedaleopsis nitida]|nr:hypothetical protein C8Q80DRAFT_609348 [Daedaleopsis nitida]
MSAPYSMLCCVDRRLSLRCIAQARTSCTGWSSRGARFSASNTVVFLYVHDVHSAPGSCWRQTTRIFNASSTSPDEAWTTKEETHLSLGPVRQKYQCDIGGVPSQCLRTPPPHAVSPQPALHARSPWSPALKLVRGELETVCDDA